MKNIFAKTSLAPALSAVLLFACSLFLCAQAPSSANISRTHVEKVRIFFPFDSDVLNPDYLSNPAALAEIESALASGASDKLDISLVSYSSPEGNYNYNRDLSRRRAAAVQNYFKSKYTGFSGFVSVEPVAECWDDLRLSVESDTRVSADVRSTMLSIIDSDRDPDGHPDLAGTVCSRVPRSPCRLYVRGHAAVRHTPIRTAPMIC